MDSQIYSKDKRDEKTGESRCQRMPIKAILTLAEMGNIHLMEVHTPDTNQSSLHHQAPQALSLPWS